VESLFQVSITCVNCHNSFSTSRVRPSFKKPASKDTDFYSHYKEINPDFYVVRVCPFCGFATTEHTENQLSNEHKEAFDKKISSQWTMRDYGGERTWDEAMQTFKLGLLCCQIKEEKPRVIAGILHHISWLYRGIGDQANEYRFMKFALDAYIKVFETEQMDLNNARLMYLIGELNRRLGNYNDAVQWFMKVIQDKRIMDASMIKACREQWSATREDMLAAKMELPEEMMEKEKKA
jgi:uncharacterized protein (DUF2225 family)